MDEDDSDENLWIKSLSGEEQAFRMIFDRHRDRVFRTAYRRLGNRADAEDVVSIVFFEAWRLRERIRVVDGSLMPWLLAVASYATLNLARAQRRHRALVTRLPPSPYVDDHAPGIDEEIDLHQVKERRFQALLHLVQERLETALRELSPADRSVVELCLIEERPIAFAADLLGVPPGTIKSRLHRARNRLRTALADEWEPAGDDGGATGR